MTGPRDSILADFEAKVLAPLTRVARAARRRALLAAAAVWLAALIGLLLSQFALDRLLALGVGPRVVVTLAIVALALRLLRRHVWWAVAAKPRAEHVVAVLERRHPDLHDRLISAVAFAERGDLPSQTSPALAAELMRQAMKDAAALNPSEVFNRSRLHRSLAIGGVALITAGVLSAAASSHARVYLARNWLLQDEPWPSNVRLALEGFSDGLLRWPLGDDLTLAVTAEGAVPPGVAVEIVAPDGQSRVRDMALRGERQFVLDYGPLDESFKLRLLIRRFGADESTGWFNVVGVMRPSIRSVRMEITPPAYSGVERFALPAGQSAAEVLRGSTIALIAKTSKPLRAATLRGSTGLEIPAKLEENHQLTAEFQPVQSGSYHFDLLDQEGLSDLRPVTFALRLVNDPPPKVKLSLPGAGDAVVPQAVIDLAVQADDNLGMKDVSLVYRIRKCEAIEGPAPDSGIDAAAALLQTTVALPGLEPRQTRFELRHVLQLLPLTLQPGDQLTLLVEARDLQPAGSAAPPTTTTTATADGDAILSEPGLGRSAAFTLRIVTAEELLAELGRRESEWRREFELLIKTQEQIRDRVMNLNDEARAEFGSARFAAQYASEQRAQRQIAVRMTTIRRQFEQILAELRTNQLDNPIVRRRLDAGILAPLGRLISSDLPGVADQLGQLAGGGDTQIADTIERGHAAILEIMYSVLANMLKWEGYNEAVTLLRDIIRLHGDVTRQTQTQLESEIDRLLGGGATSKPARDGPPSEPQP
ncbi:MAG: hypothetical protein HBSAPP02_08070 [Phycisphaerae bacterium]|nr:MAG: hypothetical protein HRU71_00485 [Planctomycetia bacterium]GJQ25775.1 MAG: hypothetical protein HBSAPP02_08070 [Phycisphaerae bacterium]